MRVLAYFHTTGRYASVRLRRDDRVCCTRRGWDVVGYADPTADGYVYIQVPIPCARPGCVVGCTADDWCWEGPFSADEIELVPVNLQKGSGPIAGRTPPRRSRGLW